MPIAIPTGKVKFGWITVLGWSGLIKRCRRTVASHGDDHGAGRQGIDQPGGFKEVLDKEFRTKGATLLAMTDIGSPAIVSSKKILSPRPSRACACARRLKGMAELIKLLGGSPVAIPFAEIYTALQHGTIELRDHRFPGHPVAEGLRSQQVCHHSWVVHRHRHAGLRRQRAMVEQLLGGRSRIIAKAIREAELSAARRSSRIVPASRISIGRRVWK